MKLNEEIFKKAAEEYALKYGEQMLEKADKLNSEIKAVPVKSAPEIIDRAQKQSANRSKKMQIALIAACSALAVIIPFSAKTILNKNAAVTSDTAYEAASAPEENAEFNEAASAQSAEQADAEIAPSIEDENSSSDESTALSDETQSADIYKGAFSSQIINIEKNLPKGFSFVSVHEDNGSAEAQIEDGFGDTVFLSLSEADGSAENYERLAEYDIGGIYAYGAAYPDYSYLTYEKDGTRYTLTSKYGLTELLDLAEAFEG